MEKKNIENNESLNSKSTSEYLHWNLGWKSEKEIKAEAIVMGIGLIFDMGCLLVGAGALGYGTHEVYDKLIKPPIREVRSNINKDGIEDIVKYRQNKKGKMILEETLYGIKSDRKILYLPIKKFERLR